MQILHIYSAIARFNEFDKSNTRYEDMKLDVLVSPKNSVLLYIAEKGKFFEESKENLKGLHNYIEKHFPILSGFSFVKRFEELENYRFVNLHKMEYSDFSEEDKLRHAIECRIFDLALEHHKETTELFIEYRDSFIPDFKDTYRKQRDTLSALKEIDPVKQPKLFSVTVAKIESDLKESFKNITDLMQWFNVDIKHRSKHDLTKDTGNKVSDYVVELLEVEREKTRKFKELNSDLIGMNSEKVLECYQLKKENLTLNQALENTELDEREKLKTFFIFNEDNFDVRNENYIKGKVATALSKIDLPLKEALTLNYQELISLGIKPAHANQISRWRGEAIRKVDKWLALVEQARQEKKVDFSDFELMEDWIGEESEDLSESDLEMDLDLEDDLDLELEEDELEEPDEIEFEVDFDNVLEELEDELEDGLFEEELYSQETVDRINNLFDKSEVYQGVEVVLNNKKFLLISLSKKHTERTKDLNSVELDKFIGIKIPLYERYIEKSLNIDVSLHI
ncbi:hypothetical protein MA785_000822 [Vibrio parahaemolyticus]|nr:hypothetical protein [Vibrio parahaemolyticus]EJR2787931.1 hypothetical protein [Vibrio parahaemolyticus]